MKGIDVPIDYTRDLLVSDLWNLFNYTPYGRVFGNERDGGLSPEIYLSEGDYKDVLLDDTLEASSFFYVLPIRNEIAAEASVWIVFNVNVESIYSALSGRNEQAEQAIIDARETVRFTPFRVESVVTGIDSIKEFVYSDQNKMDMHPYFPFRFECKVNYSLNNC